LYFNSERIEPGFGRIDSQVDAGSFVDGAIPGIWFAAQPQIFKIGAFGNSEIFRTYGTGRQERAIAMSEPGTIVTGKSQLRRVAAEPQYFKPALSEKRSFSAHPGARGAETDDESVTRTGDRDVGIGNYVVPGKSRRRRVAAEPQM
jgi:hypothetical protein